MSPPKDVEHVLLPSPNMQDIPIVAGALAPHSSRSLLMSNDTTPTFSTSGPKPHALSRPLVQGYATPSARFSPYPPSTVLVGCPDGSQSAHFTSQQSSGNSSKARRMRGTLKKNRTGVRESLYQKFGQSFWELVNNMTAEEYTRCTPAQQEYINKQKKTREMSGASIS